MKVVLLQDVKTIGKKDQIVQVSDGYARNFLFPKNLAKEANNSSIAEVQRKKASADKLLAQKNAEALALANELRNKELTIKAKLGENGKIYGRLTNSDVAKAITKTYNKDIDKKKIEISEPIKSIGNYVINIKIFNGITTTMKLNVVQEN